MLIIWIGLALSAISRPACGQTISFLRELSMQYQQAGGAAVDATGVYTVGWEGDRSSPVGLVRKHDARGNEVWSRRFENSLLSSVAVDATGGIYVAGSGPTWEGDVFLSKLTSQGNPLWTRQAGRGRGALLASNDSGVYMAWTRVEGPLIGVAVRKYTAEGDVLWSANPVVAPTSFEASIGLAANATGVYLSGHGSVEQRSTSFLRGFAAGGGQELWTRRLENGNHGRLAADASGLYLVDPWPGALRKYSLGGDELWMRQAVTRSSLAAVVVDASGVYVGGFVEKTLPGQCASGSYDAVVQRYTADGGEVWTRQFGLPGDAGGTRADAGGSADAVAIAALAADAGALYMTGFTGQGKALLARLEKALATIPATKPHIYWDCVVNAASYVGGGVAPGEIVSIFGSAIGPSELVRLRLAEDGRLATTLAETRILFNGAPAPLLYVSDRQSSAIVPYAMAGRPSVEVQVEHRGVRSEAVTVPVLASRPGIFSIDGSGGGQGAILNEDGSLNSPSNPAGRGSIVTIYATGGGEAAPGVVDGQILGRVLPTTSLRVSAFFDFDYVFGEDAPTQAEVLYAGGSFGSVAGLLQVNVRVPSDAKLQVVPGESVPIALLIGRHMTPFQTTIALR
jgi:uncharacterized protein (TIGR03437 family)